MAKKSQTANSKIVRTDNLKYGQISQRPIWQRRQTTWNASLVTPITPVSVRHVVFAPWARVASPWSHAELIAQRIQQEALVCVANGDFVAQQRCSRLETRLNAKPEFLSNLVDSCIVVYCDIGHRLIFNCISLFLYGLATNAAYLLAWRWHVEVLITIKLTIGLTWLEKGIL